MSAAPGLYSPIQSVGVGVAIPLHAASSAPPAVTVAGVMVRTAPVATREMAKIEPLKLRTYKRPSGPILMSVIPPKPVPMMVSSNSAGESATRSPRPAPVNMKPFREGFGTKW